MEYDWRGPSRRKCTTRMFHLPRRFWERRDANREERERGETIFHIIVEASIWKPHNTPVFSSVRRLSGKTRKERENLLTSNTLILLAEMEVRGFDEQRNEQRGERYNFSKVKISLTEVNWLLVTFASPGGIEARWQDFKKRNTLALKILERLASVISSEVKE